MRKFVLISTMLIVTGCSLFTGNTNEQRLFEVLNNYKSLQQVAISYKQSCEAGELADKDCSKKVLEMATIDNKIQDYVGKIDTNNINGNVTSTAISAISLAVTELSIYIASTNETVVIQ